MEKKLNNKEKLNISLLYIETCIQNIEVEMIKERKLNITHREMIYIVLIDFLQGRKMSTIAKALGISKGAFSNTVNSLIKKNMIKKTKSKEDPRKMTLEIVGDGYKAIELHTEAREVVHKKIAEEINKETYKNMIDISETILKYMEKTLK